MVDQFLLGKIRERMKEKDASLVVVRRSLASMYKERDIAEAIAVYEEERKKEELAKQERRELEQARKRKSYRPALSANSIMNFLLTNPALWLIISAGVIWLIIRLVLSSVGEDIPLNRSGFTVFLLLALVLAFLFLVKLLTWILNYFEQKKEKSNQFLKAVQFQIIQIAAVSFLVYFLKSQSLSAFLFILLVAIVFEVTLISFLFVVSIRDATITFFLYQVGFGVVMLIVNLVVSALFLKQAISGYLF
ncbi:MAG: hypothetical protein V1743_06795 [Nanoarchaeota archaeon]